MPTSIKFTTQTYGLEIDMQDWVRNFNMDGEDYIRAVAADPDLGDDEAREVVSIINQKLPVTGIDDPSLEFSWDVHDADRTYVFVKLSVTLTILTATYDDLILELRDLLLKYWRFADDTLDETQSEEMGLQEDWDKAVDMFKSLRKLSNIGKPVDD